MSYSLMGHPGLFLFTFGRFHTNKRNLYEKYPFTQCLIPDSNSQPLLIKLDLSLLNLHISSLNVLYDFFTNKENYKINLMHVFELTTSQS